MVGQPNERSLLVMVILLVNMQPSEFFFVFMTIRALLLLAGLNVTMLSITLP